MSSYKIYTSLIIAIFIQTIGFSQEGIPYISYLESKEGNEVQNWSLCQDDHNAMLFASRKGLLKYDGNDWSKIDCPFIPVKIRKNPYTGTVYVLSENNYGYLEKDLKGVTSYSALTLENEINENLSDIYFTDSTVIFYGNSLISIHNSETNVLHSRLSRSSGERFSGLILTANKIYLNRFQDGLYNISGDNIVKTDIESVKISDSDILFSLPHTENEQVLGLSNGELLTFDGLKLSEYPLSNKDYLRENILSDGLIINDSIYAFSTLYGGVILVRKTDGEILFTLNNDSGLPDDEIYSMGTDHGEGLWLSYEFGTCRIDLRLPVKEYSTYPGLEGLFTNTYWYNNELYVSTTEGLYYLSEVKNYEDVEVFFREKIEVEEKTDRRSVRRREKAAKDTEKRRFLSGLFKRDKEEPEDSKKLNRREAESEETQLTTFVKKKVSKLQSIEYVYKKVKGLGSRCEQFYAIDEGLLVGSSSGLYLVNDHEAERIIFTRNIESISPGIKEKQYLVTGEEGLFILSKDEMEWKSRKLGLNEPLFSAISTDSSTIWVSGYDLCYRLTNVESDSLQFQLFQFKSVYPEEIHLGLNADTLYLFSSTDILKYSVEADSFISCSLSGFQQEDLTTLEYFGQGVNGIWLKKGHKVFIFGEESNTSTIWSLFNKVTSCNSDNKHGIWTIDQYQRIFKVESSIKASEETKLKIFIENIYNERGEYYAQEKLQLEPGEKLIRIKVSAPSYYKDQSTLYQYRIEEKMEHWSRWSDNSTLEIITEPGTYHISIQARNILNEISNPLRITFNVKAPFYRTKWFYLLMIPIVVAVFFLIMRMRERKLRKDKMVLEEKVQERTIEISKQKNKIEIQKDEILAQKNDITSSITYASRIQHAILPARKIFEKAFSDYFIFFRPRDIVSGDFYWITERKDEVIFAAADCTGHGVPGAFMSMLGNSFLNEISKENIKHLAASDILNQLREKILVALSQSGEEKEAQDGMDIALCVYNKKKGELEYSGAYNPLYIVRKGVLKETRADRMPIGYHPGAGEFTNHKLKVEKDDVIYLFSDGFHDQFGGPGGKKFTAKRFKQMLVEISEKDMSTQQDELQLKLDYWQRHYEQVDDILVLGVRL